jgi:hypothetical protein
MQNTLDTHSDRRGFCRATFARANGLANRLDTATELCFCGFFHFCMYIYKMATDDKEVDWTKSIDNATICRYYYVFFFLVLGLAAVVLVMDVRASMLYPPKLKWVPFANIPALALAIVNALFLYILCSRSLLK